MEKEKLREKLEEARFEPITEETFKLYDEFEFKCVEDNDQQGLQWLSFYKGEALFRRDEYLGAQKLLNSCLTFAREDELGEVHANCCNILGLIYMALGYEISAMENFTKGIEIAEKIGADRRKAIIEINMASLYRQLGDYDNAFKYFKECYDLMQLCEEEMSEYSISQLTLAYMGQIAFDLKDYEEGLKYFHIVNSINQESSDTFYSVNIYILRVLAYLYLGDRENFEKNMDLILELARNDEDFLECYGPYFGVCKALIDYDREYCEKMLKVLSAHIEDTDFAYLQHSLHEIKLMYMEKYSSEEDFLAECKEYVYKCREFRNFSNTYTLSNINNISEVNKIRKERELFKQMSSTDGLTTLQNKTAFTDTATHLLSMRLFAGDFCGMCVIDVDDFKQVNDVYGHINGDKCLKITAELMKHSFNTAATLGRIGGDEFAVFWPEGTNPDLMTEQTERFLQHYSSYNWVTDDNKEYKPTVSIGLLITKQNYTYKDIYKLADHSLYISKTSGKGKITKTVR